MVGILAFYFILLKMKNYVNIQARLTEANGSKRITIIDSGRRWLLNDVAGKPIRLWDMQHRQTEYSYDALQRPNNTSLRLSALAVSLVEKIVYGTATSNNQKGQIAEQYDQSGKTTFTAYDFKGNVLSLAKQLCRNYKQTIDWNRTPAMEQETFVQSFTYDAMNRPTKITKPDNTVEQYSYNKAGLLESVQARIRGAATWTPFVSDINYNEKGQRTDIYFGNDSKTKYEYDENTFRLTRLLTTRYKGQDILQDLNYQYDPVGNITKVEDDAQQTFYFDNAVIAPTGTYTYDALYRLTEATGRELKGLAMPANTDFANNIALPNPAANAMQNYTQQYTYDALGNILQTKSKSYWTRDYYYDNNTNRLLNHDGRTDVYHYDAHGNTTAMPHLSSMQYDYADRLKQTDLGGGGDVWYVYDASGERVRKIIEKTGGIKEERIYLGGYEVYTKTTNGVENTRRETLHISDGSKRIAIIDTVPGSSGGIVETQDSVTIRYQYDNHLGSACLELDKNAAIISYEEYHPFGTTSYRSGRTETEVSLKRYKYVGKERDEETGLYYYGARYYAGWLCRWISTDPAGLVDGANMYVYVKNNPLRYADPTGMQSEDEVDQTHPPTKPEIKWNYNQQLTESWYPDRQDLSLYTSDEFIILKQDVSTHDNLHATDYYYLNEDNWKPFEPAKSTFKEDVEKFALYPILFSGGAVAGSILIESLIPLAVEGIKASVPYLAKGTLAAAEEAGLAYEAAQGIVATYPTATGIGLEFMMSNIPGVEPINNPYSSVYSEITRFFFTAYNLFKENAPNSVIQERNYGNLPTIPADNTYLQKPIDPIIRMDVLENKSKTKK